MLNELYIDAPSTAETPCSPAREWMDMAEMVMSWMEMAEHLIEQSHYVSTQLEQAQQSAITNDTQPQKILALSQRLMDQSKMLAGCLQATEKLPVDQITQIMFGHIIRVGEQ